MEKATRQHTKAHNRNLVFTTIIGHDKISRAEIARITSLTPATVSDIVADLIKGGLVGEVGIGPSIGGKNPILLGLREDARWLIGLDLAVNEFRGAVVNLRGKISETVTIQVKNHEGNEALSLVYEMLDQLIAKAHQPLVGIGVGAPGLINASEGMVINAVNLNWKNLPLTQLLTDRYHLPVCIMNDCQAAAIGERTYAKDHIREENLILINLRHGIGSGIVINGSLFQGDGGSAGEIGHVVVMPENGELCRCGNRGCLETVASVQALLRHARALAGQYPHSALNEAHGEITLEQIEVAFAQEDDLARRLVLDTAYYTGMAIASLVGTFNIQKIVLSGDMTHFGVPWLQKINETMKHMALETPLTNTTVEIGQLGNDGIILGAAAVLANNYSLLFNPKDI